MCDRFTRKKGQTTIHKRIIINTVLHINEARKNLPFYHCATHLFKSCVF